MTERTDDGRPDTYRDPRDRLHPKVLRVTVRSFEKMHNDMFDTNGAVGDGEEQAATVSFRSVYELRKTLTDRRIQLLRTLIDINGAAESISSLAEELGRDYREVHDDAISLAGHGLMYLVREGQARRPYLPYERLHFDFEIGGHAVAGESISAQP